MRKLNDNIIVYVCPDTFCFELTELDAIITRATAVVIQDLISLNMSAVVLQDLISLNMSPCVYKKKLRMRY